MDRIIIVTVGSIYRIPPIKSLLESLAIQKKEIIVITTNDGIDLKDTLENRLTIIKTSSAYYIKCSIFNKAMQFQKVRKELWNNIERFYTNDSLLWILSDLTVKVLGKKLLKTNYILQLYELVEKKYLVPKYKFIDLRLSDYAKNAKRVIVPEYNRAHITQAWWELDKLPFVLENKPFYSEISEERNILIKHSDVASNIISKLEGKKIILYQGILHKERPLENFIKAVDKLGGQYAFVVMSGEDNIYKECGSSNYYFIPYISAPYHLEVTSHAFIGVLSYVPTKTTNSILNAIYCAPNKTFEYGRYRVPMVSNDVPALRFCFNRFECGLCVDIEDVDSICKGILTITKDYETFSNNARIFYDNVDYTSCVLKLINEVCNGSN